MRFSVVVPVYQHWHLVSALVRCLERQTLPSRDFEVLLVDNDSQDFAPPETLPANMRVLRCAAPGSYAARNHAATEARGAWLAFTDADCRPDYRWLEALGEAIRNDPERALVAGAVEVVAVSERPAAAEIYDIVKGIPQERYVLRGYAATANLAIRRDVFEALGGFDGARFSGGDADFCRRSGRHGFSLAYAREARVAHPARSSWLEVATKARRIKGGQLAAGVPKSRRFWLLGTLNPPVFGALRFLRDRRHPLGHRLTAILVLFGVWGVGLAEAVRLKAGGAPERR